MSEHYKTGAHFRKLQLLFHYCTLNITTLSGDLERNVLLERSIVYVQYYLLRSKAQIATEETEKALGSQFSETSVDAGARLDESNEEYGEHVCCSMIDRLIRNS